MGCSHDSEERGLDEWHVSRWLWVPWSQKAVEPSGHFVCANRAIKHTVLRRRIPKNMSYVVSRGRVAPVVRTPQLYPTQPASVHVPTVPANCRQGSNQVLLPLTAEVIERSYGTAH